MDYWRSYFSLSVSGLELFVIGKELLSFGKRIYLECTRVEFIVMQGLLTSRLDKYKNKWFINKRM